jgi:hypothetical protein
MSRSTTAPVLAISPRHAFGVAHANRPLDFPPLIQHDVQLRAQLRDIPALLRIASRFHAVDAVERGSMGAKVNGEKRFPRSGGEILCTDRIETSASPRSRLA